MAPDDNGSPHAAASPTGPANDPQVFGGCPKCGKNDGYLNFGRNHWVICHAHRIRWCLGENLFSDWRSESQAEWDRNAELIGPYECVEPPFMG